MKTLAIAFKEWAAVCDALATGRQTLLFRKGGIAETGGVFRPEHDRFWLYPTYFHEKQPTGLKSGIVSVENPHPGIVRLSHFAEVTNVQYLTDLDAALAFDAEHIWTAETIRQRFHYRTPGLYLLKVKIWKAGVIHNVIERPEYAGCKTWVPLVEPLATDPAERIPQDLAAPNKVLAAPFGPH